MPGISLIIDKLLYQRKDEIRKSLDSLNYLQTFTSEELINGEFLFMGSNKHGEYPISSFSFKNYLIFIEGVIYNKGVSELISEISRLISSLEKNDFEKKLKDWIFSADGDYIIFIINKDTNDILIFNDIFGRLPVYFYQSDTGVIVSRYLKFITNIIKNYELDKIALSEFLLLGYMLGQRTLFKNIYHLRPSTVLYITNFQVKSKTIYQFNFDERKYNNYPFEKNVENLASLFTQAAVNRLNNSKKNIVTLSGGLDSRLVASCLYKNNIPFEVATLVTRKRGDEEEVKIACKLSKIYNANFNVFELHPPTGKDFYELLKIKEGMNSLSTAALLMFYRKIKDRFGTDINFITGDNGDKLIFTFDMPLKSFVSREKLANYIINEHSLMSINTVSEILKISKNEIIEELVRILESFPEKNIIQQYIHFRVIEKPFKYAFQGEDRHRNYFWHLTPFWSVHFFDYIMNLSERSKTKHKLFSNLIGTFSADALKLTYTNFKSSVVSLKGKLFLNLVYYGYPLIPSKIKGGLKNGFFGGNPRSIDEPVLLKSILEEYKDSEKAAEILYLNENILKNFRKIPLFNLLTLTSAIQEFYEKENSLRKYFSEEFY